MKLRSVVLALASLLLTAPVAGAEPASTPPASALAAALFSAPGSPDCADAELSWLASAPGGQGNVPCGACSDTICQGKQFGQFCKYQSGRYYYCQPAYVVCDPDDCQCWTGPLP